MPPAGARSDDAAALIARIAQGDREAFSRFYDAFARTVFGLIRRVLRDSAPAEEVLQEVFWQVWRDASQFDPRRGSPETWLLMRAKSRAIDTLRSIRRREKTFVMPVDESVEYPAQAGADAPAAEVESRGLLESALAKLPADPRWGIVFAFCARLTTPALSARTGGQLALCPASLSSGKADIAAIAVGLSISASYEKRLDALAREAVVLKDEIERERRLDAILRDRDTEIVTLSGREPAPAARARMIWNAHAGGLLVAAGLPPTPAGKAYQLWAIVGKNPPVSAGVFTVDAKGAGSLRVPPLTGV